MEKEHVERLLKEFEDHRDSIKVMIEELDVIKKNIDRLIPTSLDARYIRFFEEKVKSITSLFTALLEMRKEITKSVREEIEIRRKIDIGEGIDEIEDMIDVRKVVSKIETFKDETKKFKESLEEQDLTKYSNIQIPGVNTLIER